MNIEMFINVGVMFFTYAVMVLLISFIPYYIRKDIAFGVSVPESEHYTEYFKKLRWQYLSISLLSGALLAVGSSLMGIWGNKFIGEWLQLIPIAVFLVISGSLYVTFYFRVRKFKNNSNWEVTHIVSAALTIDVNERKQLNPLWFTIYLVIIIVTVVMAFTRYPSLPDLVPRHYNIMGQVDAYTTKSISNLLVIPITQAILAALFLGYYFMIFRAKNQSGAGDPVEGLKRDRTFKAISIKGIFLIGLMVVLMLGLVEFSMLGFLSQWITAAAPIVILVVIITAVLYFITKVGQGGSRIGIGKSNLTQVAMDDDSHWILGFFYVNKDDPSVFVERRFGIGWTLNLANPKGLMMLIAVIAVLAGALYLPLILK